MTTISSINPRTGEIVEALGVESSLEDVDAACRAATEAAGLLESIGRFGRATLLRAVAEALEADAHGIVALADRETALGEPRLRGELVRTCVQLRLFADVLEEGSYIGAMIDHGGDTPIGARPDLRRMLVPVGPVAVFGSSNFPLAFSVPGGDTASALAAGCPVVAKVHPSHPATSRRCYDSIQRGLSAAGAPPDALTLVQGQRAGASLVQHPAVRAVGFTGSLAGGRALYDMACQRPDPIPFYGELSSINPVVVSSRAVAERVEDLAGGFVASFTLGVGQFCTKPGIMFVPAGDDAEKMRARLASAVATSTEGWMLNAGIRDAFRGGAAELRATDGVSVVAEAAASGGGFAAAPLLLELSAANLTARTMEECFGPIAILATYESVEELLDVLRALPGSLTGSIHTTDAERAFAVTVADTLRPKVGRLVFNGFPTGVAVSWAMNHGGPWPATTNPLHTSVGASSICRFMRPVCWQNAPAFALPDELKDVPSFPLPRRIDGRLTLGTAPVPPAWS